MKRSLDLYLQEIEHNLENTDILRDQAGIDDNTPVLLHADEGKVKELLEGLEKLGYIKSKEKLEPGRTAVYVNENAGTKVQVFDRPRLWHTSIPTMGDTDIETYITTLSGTLHEMYPEETYGNLAASTMLLAPEMLRYQVTHYNQALVVGRNQLVQPPGESERVQQDQQQRIFAARTVHAIGTAARALNMDICFPQSAGAKNPLALSRVVDYQGQEKS